jgi:hypothetical protein
MLSDRVYNVLKWVGLVCIPGVAWFVGQVGPRWGMSNVDAVVTTLNSAGTLLGVLIGVSTIQYNNGAGNGSQGA